MAIYAISAALIIILCLAVAFFLRFSWFTPLEQLIEQLYGRQEKDRTENKTIEKLERAIRFAIKRQQNHDSEEVERLNELLSEVESQHKEKQAHQVEERSKLEALHQEIQDEKVYLGAVQDLSEHALRQLIGAVNRGGERAEVTKAAENISFLLAEKQDTGTRSTENILELIDNVFQLLAPLLSRYQCRFHVVPDLNSPANLELAAANFRRILFRLILDYLRPDRKGNHKLEFTYEADSLNLNFSRDFTPQISLALDDRIAESGADWRDNQLEFPANLPDSRITAPVDCGLTALVIADDEYERESLAARLNLMGLGSTTDFKSELLDICLVSDESSDTYLSIKHYLPETTWVVLLNSRTVINRPYWIQLADPITQAELTTAIEHIGHARDESRLINALVVDDSTANAKLLALQLTELGHSVSKAESGREAIQKVAEESFQIIFMDIQMPDMNGVEATRRIREFGSKIPVFGLTAHATSQEKKAYRDTGMDDVLIKPVRMENLKSILRQLGRLGARAPMPVPASHSLELFDKELALRNANHRPELAAELMGILVTSLPEDQQSINDSTHDFSELKQAVHKLHGAVRYCGVPRLGRAIEKLESALKQADNDQIPLLLNLLNGEITALEAWYRDHPDPFSQKADTG